MNRRLPGSGPLVSGDYPFTCEEGRMTTTRGRADWREAGACAHADPDLFFPISSTGRALEQIAKAKATCTGMPGTPGMPGIRVGA